MSSIINSVLPQLLVASGGHGGAHEINAWELGGQTFTFLVFVIGLVVLTRKSFRKLFLTRHETVKTAVEEAKRAKAEAEAKFAEYQKKMNELDAELGILRANVAKNAEAEKARLMEDADATAKRIARDTEALITSELRRAEEQLRTQASELAVALAGEILKKEMKADDHTRLVKDYVASISSDGSKQKAA